MLIKFLFHLSVFEILLTSSATFFQAKPGCQPKCGNISIPYPFGLIGEGQNCSIDPALGYGYSIRCNTSYDPPKPFIGNGNLEIVSITDTEIQIRTKNRIATLCYNVLGELIDDETMPWYTIIDLIKSPFTFSYTKNKYFSIGCDTLAAFESITPVANYSNQCRTTCSSKEQIVEGDCMGRGCCQTTMPKLVRRFEAIVDSYENHTKVWSFDHCGYSFVADQEQYKFHSSDLLLQPTDFMQKMRNIPLVLDWAIGNKTCEEANKDLSLPFACQGNSYCNNSDNNLGYRCICHKGFEGNPYLSPGCQDTNECADQNNNPCVGICTNTPGSFICSCPDGNKGDGRKDGRGCIDNKQEFPILGVTLGTGLGFIFLILGTSLLFFTIKKRNMVKIKEKYFKQNGGLLLKQQISSKEAGGLESTKIFTSEELKLATNNYDESQILGSGGYGIVYKGTLPSDVNRFIAVKKSKVIDPSQIEQFINEVVILTQVKHRNVVKLLGCCLETEVPLLVYEYVSNGTLFQHIHHKKGMSSSLSWGSRLRIASEIASALAYLHSAASTPVIHRDMKSANVLLDDDYTAKVSDFGASRLVPLDQTHLHTLVLGTLGYLDPDYYHTSLLTEKSDVYSFGVVLVELLTGQKPISLEKPEEERNLATYFISLLEQNDVSRILEARVVEEGEMELILEVSELAKKCLNSTGADRPKMQEVATKLERLSKLEMEHAWADDAQPASNVIRSQLPSEPKDLYSIPIPSSSNTVSDSGQYSSGTEAPMALNIPR